MIKDSDNIIKRFR